MLKLHLIWGTVTVGSAASLRFKNPLIGQYSSKVQLNTFGPASTAKNPFQPQMYVCRVNYVSSWRTKEKKKRKKGELCDRWDMWAQIRKSDRRWLNDGTHTHTTSTISTAVFSPWQTFLMQSVSARTPIAPPHEESYPSQPSFASPSLSSCAPSASSLWPPWGAAVAAGSVAPSSRGPGSGVWLWHWVATF